MKSELPHYYVFYVDERNFNQHRFFVDFEEAWEFSKKVNGQVKKSYYYLKD